ncbi:MAG TPA: branched-chain amino acid transaminase [Blastocatellia bacterium]|nr:branched-chain amino acid transaminase [Blastocatellia bacterium]
MEQRITRKIWHDGTFIDWEDAKIHVMAHAVNYASTVFEGIRCYATPKGPAIFRLKDHLQRLLNSCHIYRMDIPYSLDELTTACKDLVRINEVSECYIRPLVLRGYGVFGVNPLSCPLETYIVCWVWGKYLGEDALDQGVDACVSSWTRIAPNTLPALAKVAANYMNSQLIKMEAVLNGFAEGIALDANGYVSEGSGQNIFLVMGGKLLTPPLSASVLPGITRDTILHLCRLNGFEVTETPIPREMLYIADEVFFVGTAAEITPIRSIDRIPIGSGKRGPITRHLQEEFFAITSGRKEAPDDWLTFVT